MFKISTTALLFLAARIVVAAENCQLSEINPSQIDVLVGSRTVSIIGWQPPTHQQAAVMINSFNQAVAFAAKDECGGAQYSLGLALHNLGPNILQSEKVHELLVDTHKRHPLSGIGVSHSPQEREQLASLRKDFPFDMSLLRQKCGKKIQDTLEKYSYLRPGAEALFVQKNQNVTLEGVEDHPLRVRQVQIENTPIPKIENERTELFKVYYDNIRQRNAYIAQNILSKKGNYAVIVNQPQAKDLAAQIQTLCVQASSVTAGN